VAARGGHVPVLGWVATLVGVLDVASFDGLGAHALESGIDTIAIKHGHVDVLCFLCGDLLGYGPRPRSRGSRVWHCCPAAGMWRRCSPLQRQPSARVPANSYLLNLLQVDACML